MIKNKKIDLSVNLAGLKLKNPVIAASGTYGYGSEYTPFVKPSEFGAIITKTITLLPRPGNAPPRICETSGGMLNSIGLANVGIDVFIKEKLAKLAEANTVIIANIAGNTPEEYTILARKLNNLPPVEAIELNISCPNVKQGGIAFGTNPKTAGKLVRAVRKVYQGILIVKLSPNISDITVIAKAAESAGADALSLINTLYGMAVNIKTQKPILGNITGGLSGPAIKPIALYHLHKTYDAVKIPLIGLGGISNADDAIEFMLTGARAVQIGTANFSNPQTVSEILQGMTKYCSKNNIKSIDTLVGKLKC